VILPASLEQGIPQNPFKVPDRLAKRRLRHPQLRRRIAEVHGFGDGKKVAQMPELNFLFHHRSPKSASAGFSQGMRLLSEGSTKNGSPVSSVWRQRRTPF
jgi:hypothetical protein